MERFLFWFSLFDSAVLSIAPAVGAILRRSVVFHQAGASSPALTVRATFAHHRGQRRPQDAGSFREGW
jgi:hypothetical protein